MNNLSVTAAVAISVAISVFGSAGVTWALWAYCGIAASGWAVYVTLLAIIVMYTMPLILLLARRPRNLVLMTLAATSGLLITLVVSPVINEIVHCQYDRAGCVNL